jgi:hypothetical protein
MPAAARSAQAASISRAKRNAVPKFTISGNSRAMHVLLSYHPAVYQRVMTTLESVKNWMASVPWPCMVPKKLSF